MRALAGRRILLTRAAEDCAAWAEELAALGAEPVVFPCIECRTIDTAEAREAVADALPASDWLVFTSRRGVAALRALSAEPLAATLKIAAVGAATARYVREALGRDVDLVSEEGTAASLAAALKTRASAATRLLVVVAENAGDTIESTLAPTGATCLRVDAYRTLPAVRTGAPRALSTLGVDNVVLASPSAVAGFVQRVDIDVAARVISIGPATSAAARRHGLEITGEARRPTLEGLVEALQCAN
jgi:uroporphyrinogen-III synthase